MEKKFVCLLPDAKSVERLKKIAGRFGLDYSKDFSGQDCEEFEFHMTLIFSNEESDAPNAIMPLGAPITVNCAVLCQLGEKATALRTTNNVRINQLRNNLMRTMKVTHSYDDFLPHVSLSYVPPTSELQFPVNTWYFPITFDRIKVSSQK